MNTDEPGSMEAAPKESDKAALSRSAPKKAESITINPNGGSSAISKSFLHAPSSAELKIVEQQLKQDMAFRYAETGYRDEAYFDQKEIDVSKIRELAEQVLLDTESQAKDVKSDVRLKVFFKDVEET